MEDFTFYTFCHREYFEPLSHWRRGSLYADLLLSLLPAGWTVSSYDIWLRGTPEGARLRPHGFKIHVSASLQHAQTVLRRVVPECVRSSTPFKVVGDPTLHGFMNSKRCARSGSGKFITIYPRDDAAFVELLEALFHTTGDLEGPYILSDRRYRDSKVLSYRYGGFQKLNDLLIDGTRRTMIRRPDGTLVPDRRTPYFQLPEWVQDPFPDDAQDAVDELLNGRYRVMEALSLSNTGGVYRAVDSTNGRTVVIKEARPHTLSWSGHDVPVDSLVALHHERAVLERLKGLPSVPALIDMYQEWEHTFLVVSHFDGMSLRRLRALDTFMVLSQMDDRARVAQFSRVWRDLTCRLLDAVEAIHERGVIVGDISPGNVLLNEATGEIALIDFEGARLTESGRDVAPLGIRWFSPGFRKPERRGQSLTQFDDFYSCGMTLYNLVCPFQTLFELDRTHPRFRILDHFVDAGLPPHIRSTIEALLDGRVADARRHAQPEPIGEELNDDVTAATALRV